MNIKFFFSLNICSTDIFTGLCSHVKKKTVAKSVPRYSYNNNMRSEHSYSCVCANYLAAIQVWLNWTLRSGLGNLGKTTIFIYDVSWKTYV